MKGLAGHLVTTLRLYFRNRMALAYGYLFPTVFLVAFAVLYRYDRVPLIRHVGELLTVTILGGACFGLPTAMVSERERGVWRRLRLTPLPPVAFVLTTATARYLLLLSAAALQLGLAATLGMPWPERPLELWLAFTVASFAFLGLGLVIAMMADTVPAVQALGQSIFLPMLIVGGVAVPLSALPDWAQHVSAFLPGRYAVNAIQATVTTDGSRLLLFDLVALVTIGLAACAAASGMFRWDAGQRFATTPGRGWAVVGLVAWVAVGVAAHIRSAAPVASPATGVGSSPAPAAASPVAPAPRSDDSLPTDATSSPRSGMAAADERPAPALSTTGEASDAAEPAGALSSPAPATVPSHWTAVTLSDIEREIAFDRLPPDAGIVVPIAPVDREIDPDTLADLGAITDALESWPPGAVADPEQRVRNLIFVASVIDILQWPIEPLVPLVIYERLQRDFARDDLIKLLFWVAYYPQHGSTDALSQMDWFDVDRPVDVVEVQGRTGAYAAKFLGRLTGKRPGR